MSASQTSLLLHKGAVGQAYWPPTRIWHDIKVDKHPKSLDEIRVHWHKQKDGARSIIEQDMLRCVNVRCADKLIYSGMMTMCRDDQVEGEIDDLPGYRFGTVTAVSGDPNRVAATHLQIEFRFEATSGLPSRTISATGSDLLYWAVSRDLSLTNAKLKMNASDTRADNSDEDEREEKGESSGDEDEIGRPARKRQAIAKFDPATFTVSPKPRRVIQDDDSSSSDSSSSSEDSGFDRELFPESDEEEGEGSSEKQTNDHGDRNNDPSFSPWGSPGHASATPTSSWGTPASSRDSTWGVAVSSESNDSPNSNWGTTANAVTPDSGHGWGRSSSLASSSGSGGPWGHVQTSGRNESNSWNTSSSSSALQYRKMPTSRSSRIESKYLTKSEGELEIIREADDEFFLRWHFGSDRVKIIEVGLNLFENIETTRAIGTEVYTLVASKYEQGADGHNFRSRLSKFGGRPYAKCYYVAGDCRSVQKKLDSIANFSDLVLAPGKLASRLELLVSTAAGQSSGRKKTPYMFQLPASHVEEIKDYHENETMGCGFIPGYMLEDLLGNNNDAKDALAIQVRIVCPTFGIFKGILVKKAGISKIQLPTSMKKVCKSSSRKKAFEGAFLLINQGGICPSQPTRQMERAINPKSTRPPTKTAENDLHGIDNMMRRLLLGCGASAETLDGYNETCKSFQGRKHAYLTGVCDVTDGSLPPGTVFLSGWGVGEVDRTVFVTRSPCTERLDAAVLKVISQQPDEMPDDHWQHLCNLPFGSIMFASPKDVDEISLPESINNSDLDGDRFFCLWDPTLLSELELEIGIGVQTDDGNGNGGSNANVDTEERIPEENETTTGAEDGQESDESGSIWKDVTDVVGNRGKGRNAQVEIQYDGGKRNWVDRNLVMDQMPDLLADYALRENLLEEKGWGWARQYIRDAEIIEVKSHRFQGARKKTLQVEVLYDGDPNTTWINARSVDVDILAKYVEREGISLQRQEWRFLQNSIEKQKKHWLNTVQARVRNIKHLSDHNRFVTKLHGLHGKYAKEKGISDADSISLGRAYKSALDVCKHGGRVSLPRHLRDEVAGKKGLSFTQFLKDS